MQAKAWTLNYPSAVRLFQVQLCGCFTLVNSELNYDLLPARPAVADQYTHHQYSGSFTLPNVVCRTSHLINYLQRSFRWIRRFNNGTANHQIISAGGNRVARRGHSA